MTNKKTLTIISILITTFSLNAETIVIQNGTRIIHSCPMQQSVVVVPQQTQVIVEQAPANTIVVQQTQPSNTVVVQQTQPSNTVVVRETSAYADVMYSTAELVRAVAPIFYSDHHPRPSPNWGHRPPMPRPRPIICNGGGGHNGGHQGGGRGDGRGGGMRPQRR